MLVQSFSATAAPLSPMCPRPSPRRAFLAERLARYLNLAVPHARNIFLFLFFFFFIVNSGIRMIRFFLL